MANYVDYDQATTLFGDVDARFDTVEGKIPSNASSGNKMVTASDIATKADLVDGKVPSSQLPSYVDDVLEYASTSSFPATGESGKIYVATDTNKTYRWSGSDYVEISESLALGETSSTAYAGDKGKANADAISDIQDLIPSGATTSNKLATASDIPTVPTALADLTDDSTHRVVTDTEKSTWSGKQDALTFDNAPTANSDNPVKSGGVKTAIDGAISNDTAVVRSTVGWVGKNLLKPTNSSGTSATGIAYVINENGADLDGTSTAGFNVLYGKIKLSAGQYTYTDGVETTDNTYFMNLAPNPASGSGNININSKPYNFTVNSETEFTFALYVRSGQTLSHLKFYPMVTDVAVTDSTYEPYHPSVEEEINQVYADNGVLGAKNLLTFPYKNTSKTENGVTFTVNSNGSITISTEETATANATFLYIDDNSSSSRTANIIGKSLILNGVPSGETRLFQQCSAWGGTAYSDTGDGAQIDVPSNATGFNCKVVVKSGSDFTTPLTIYPMLRLASDPDSTYQPYAMTNRELTEMWNPVEYTVTSDFTLDDNFKSVFKIGRIAFANIKVNDITQAIAYTTKVCSLPSAVKPMKQTRLTILAGGNPIGASVDIYGSIIPNSTINNGNAIICATWITS